MAIIWSEQTLKQIYEAGAHEGETRQEFPNRASLGDQWPYHGGSELDIEAHLHLVVAHLSDSSLVFIEADFSSFGSGYASFVEIFCSKKDGSSHRPFLGSGEKVSGEKVSGEKVSGINFYVSRLAPVAAYGAGERTRHARGGSSTFLEYDNLGTTPPGDWKAVLDEVSAKLESDGFQIAGSKLLNRFLPFDAKIETNLGDYPHRIFDLLFHWWD